MSDRKNLISDFEYAVRKADAEGWDFVDLTTEDGFEILDMLKAQEPVKPYLDYDGSDVWRLWRCGACGTSLFHHVEDNSEEDMKNYVRYCKHCGRAVKWDE